VPAQDGKAEPGQAAPRQHPPSPLGWPIHINLQPPAAAGTRHPCQHLQSPCTRLPILTQQLVRSPPSGIAAPLLPRRCWQKQRPISLNEPLLWLLETQEGGWSSPSLDVRIWAAAQPLPACSHPPCQPDSWVSDIFRYATFLHFSYGHEA